MSVVAALLALTSCSKQEASPLMEGTAKFLTETEFAINYAPEGNMYLAQPVFFEPDSTDHHYSFDINMTEDCGDYEVIIGNQVYGVHLEKGKTAVMNIEETAPGQYSISYEGDNADISEVVSSIFPAYDLFTYSEMTDDKATPDEFITRLDKAHKGVQEKLGIIKDKDLQAWYTQFAEAKYLGTKARLLTDKAREMGIKETEMPEYMEIINSIDPNSDVSYYSMNSILWLGAQLPQDESTFGGNMLPYCLSEMELVQKSITNEKVRKFFAYTIPYYFFGYGDHKTGKEEFWTAYKEFAKDYPDFISLFEKEYNKEVKDMSEAALPEGLQLTKVDGTKVDISTLWSEGKYTYVDCWATWCGPCCKEIPHLEALVEKMADQDKVQFVSFSMDSDVDAWKKKLDADNPQWAQFILDAEANQALSEALNITGIPRFFIIGPDGSIINPDANRPSNEELEGELREL